MKFFVAILIEAKLETMNTYELAKKMLLANQASSPLARYNNHMATVKESAMAKMLAKGKKR